ncbi:hypothetical protein ACFQWC_12435 [Rossellomorea sp. GCM10028870]|uniref:hypothetical protein n=1 Tax=Rossellomorea sp. GCM10028870 TaxID=3273426 RepID=UPI0036177FD0
MKNHEEEHPYKHLIQHYLEEQMKKLNESDDNNSFVFLENKTLNLIILYLVMNSMSGIPIREEFDSKNFSIPNEIYVKLQDSINKNKQSFEEVISLLSDEGL